MKIEWKAENGRVVAYSCDAAIGAIFPGGKRIRWRAWVTKNMNPVEGTARNDGLAKLEVEQRFQAFLELAGLQQI